MIQALCAPSRAAPRGRHVAADTVACTRSGWHRAEFIRMLERRISAPRILPRRPPGSGPRASGRSREHHHRHSPPRPARGPSRSWVSRSPSTQPPPWVRSLPAARLRAAAGRYRRTLVRPVGTDIEDAVLNGRLPRASPALTSQRRRARRGPPRVRACRLALSRRGCRRRPAWRGSSWLDSVGSSGAIRPPQPGPYNCKWFT